MLLDQLVCLKNLGKINVKSLAKFLSDLFNIKDKFLLYFYNTFIGSLNDT